MGVMEFDPRIMPIFICRVDGRNLFPDSNFHVGSVSRNRNRENQCEKENDEFVILDEVASINELYLDVNTRMISI